MQQLSRGRSPEVLFAWQALEGFTLGGLMNIMVNVHKRVGSMRRDLMKNAGLPMVR